MKTKTIGILSAVIAIATLLILILFYGQIPPLTPSHYELLGIADAWEHKSLLWIIAVGNFILNIAIGFLARYPNIYNYPFEITDMNRERVYAAASRFVEVLRLVTTLVFTSITLFMSLSVEKIPILIYLCLILSPVVCLFHGIREIHKASKK